MERKPPLPVQVAIEGLSHRTSSVVFIMDPKNIKSPPTEVHTVADYAITL